MRDTAAGSHPTVDGLATRARVALRSPPCSASGRYPRTAPPRSTTLGSGERKGKVYDGTSMRDRWRRVGRRRIRWRRIGRLRWRGHWRSRGGRPGCCCVVTPTGNPGQCTTVDDPSECSMHNLYTPGSCNGSSPPGSICSASGVPSGAGGVNGVDGLVFILALAAFRAMRRRFARG